MKIQPKSAIIMHRFEHGDFLSELYVQA